MNLGESMHISKTSSIGVICLTAIAVMGAGCGKKAPVYTPPTATPAGVTAPPDTLSTKPTVVQFIVEPSVVERGQSATLRWSVVNATSISIDHGIGDVQS